MTAPTPTTDAQHVPLTRAQRLAADAAEAAAERRAAEHPDVIALQVQRIRKQIDVLMWIGIGLGLAFTMVNVQRFAADGAPPWSLPWIAAWLLDPMVSVVLIAVLRAEQVTARWQVTTGKWISRTKWFAFAATYAMNTWQSWASLHLAGIVLHSVPPLLIYLASEAAPVLRDRLTESVHRAAGDHPTTQVTPGPTVQHDTTGHVHDDSHNTVQQPVHQPVHAAAGEHPATVQQPVHADPATGAADQTTTPAARTRRQPSRTTKAKKATRGGGGRTSRQDYLAAARAAWAPGVEITPAWVRDVTGCSRGLSSALAAQLQTEPQPHPDGKAA